jgi:hypothetical protein
MPKLSEREIDDSFDRAGMILDEEDIALLEHVLLDDQRPPQGLHQGGRKD